MVLIPRSISGHCSAKYSLRIALIFVLYLFIGTRPTLSNPLPYKDSLDEGVGYVLDKDNHLIPDFVNTGYQLSGRQNPHWNEIRATKNGIFGTDSEDVALSVSIDDNFEVGLDEEDNPFLVIESASHLASEGGRNVGWDDHEAILGVINNHLIGAEPTQLNARDEDQNWRDQVNAFHKENLGKAWEMARESVRLAELQSTSETLVSSPISTSGPYKNYTAMLKENYSGIPSPSGIMEKAPAMITQDAGSELQDSTTKSDVGTESDYDNIDFVSPLIITPPDGIAKELEQVFDLKDLSEFEEFYPEGVSNPEKLYHEGLSDHQEFYPEQFPDSEEFYAEEEFSDFQEFLGSSEDLIEAEDELCEAEAELIGPEKLLETEELFGPEELFGSEGLFEPEELFKPEDFFDYKDFFDSKELVDSEEVPSSKEEPDFKKEPGSKESYVPGKPIGNFGIETLTLNGIHAPRFPISHYRPPKDFGAVLVTAVGLGLLMAISSLLIMCALSRKGQYIWIRTVKLNDLTFPTSENFRYEGESRDPPNPTGTPSRHGGGGAGNLPRGNISGSDGSEILDRRRVTILDPVSNIESPEISDAGSGSGNSIQSPNRSIAPSTHSVGGTDMSREGPGRPGFFIGSIGPIPVKKPTIFRRWFGWDKKPHSQPEKAIPRSSPPAIKSSRILSSRDRTAGPDLVTEVCERLLRERRSQLSTIPSADEEVGHGAGEERESLSTMPVPAHITRAPLQTQSIVVKKNPPGILKTHGNNRGSDIPEERPATGDGPNSHEDNRADEADSEGSSLKGKNPRDRLVVRFDGSAEKKRSFGRDSIGRSLNPTVEDDQSSSEESLASERNTTLGAADGTVIRKDSRGERIGSMWGTVFSDPLETSTDSLNSEELADLERQVNRDGEYLGSSSGSSLSNDSTLSEDSDDGTVVPNTQTLVNEGPIPKFETYTTRSNINMAARKVLVVDSSLGASASPNASTIEGTDNTDIVSAFGIRDGSPVWDSQTSDESLLSENAFTDSNSSDHISIDGPANSI